VRRQHVLYDLCRVGQLLAVHDKAHGTAKRPVLTLMVALSGFLVIIVRRREFTHLTDTHETFLQTTRKSYKATEPSDTRT
jgi:hypothetical protein